MKEETKELNREKIENKIIRIIRKMETEQLLKLIKFLKEFLK